MDFPNDLLFFNVLDALKGRWKTFTIIDRFHVSIQSQRDHTLMLEVIASAGKKIKDARGFEEKASHMLGSQNRVSIHEASHTWSTLSFVYYITSVKQCRNWDCAQ